MKTKQPKGPRTIPGTISAATPAAAARFLESLYEARRVWWHSRPKVQQRLFEEAA